MNSAIEEKILLFYYEELDQIENAEVENLLKTSTEARKFYQELTGALGDYRSIGIPEISQNAVENVMKISRNLAPKPAVVKTENGTPELMLPSWLGWLRYSVVAVAVLFIFAFSAWMDVTAPSNSNISIFWKTGTQTTLFTSAFTEDYENYSMEDLVIDRFTDSEYDTGFYTTVDNISRSIENLALDFPDY